LLKKIYDFRLKSPSYHLSFFFEIPIKCITNGPMEEALSARNLQGGWFDADQQRQWNDEYIIGWFTAILDQSAGVATEDPCEPRLALG
jgi:hypothetical protein